MPYCFCFSESLCCVSDKETSTNSHIYELVIHKLAAAGWQSLKGDMPDYILLTQMRGWPTKPVPVVLGVENPCPLKRQHVVGGRHDLSPGEALQTPWEPEAAASRRSLGPKPLITLYTIHTLQALLLLTSDLAGRGGQWEGESGNICACIHTYSWLSCLYLLATMW